MTKKAKPRAARKPKNQPASSSSATSSPEGEGAAPINRGKAGKGVRQSIVSPAPTPSILPDL